MVSFWFILFQIVSSFISCLLGLFFTFSDIDGQENLRLIVESTEFKNKTATASYVDNLGMK